MSNQSNALFHKELHILESAGGLQQQGPRLSIVPDIQSTNLTRKEQEVCNRATD
jgi:hypothetical protein